MTESPPQRAQETAREFELRLYVTVHAANRRAAIEQRDRAILEQVATWMANNDGVTQEGYEAFRRDFNLTCE